MDPIDPNAIVCRCCLKQQNNFLDFNIEYDTIHRLKDLFEKITGITPEELGSFTKCCYNCYQSLTLAFKFQQEAINSHYILQNLKVEEETYDQIFIGNEKEEEDITIKVEHTEVEILTGEGNKEIGISSLRNMRQHMLTHHNESLYDPERIREDDTIFAEEISKEPIPRCQCHHCSMTFRRQGDLQIHLIRKHFPHLQTDICNDCGKKYPTREALKQHIRKVHIQFAAYECDLCDSKFKTRRGLLEHKITHTDERPHLCDNCSATFKTMSNLNKHRKTKKCALKKHSGLERPHKCHLCTSKFVLNNDLSRHLRMSHPKLLPSVD